MVVLGGGAVSYERGTPVASDQPTAQILATNLTIGPHNLFRGGLVFKAHKLVYHSTLGVRVIKRERERKREREAGYLHFVLVVEEAATSANHQPSEWDQIVFFECLDLYHKSHI